MYTLKTIHAILVNHHGTITRTSTVFIPRKKLCQGHIVALNFNWEGIEKTAQYSDELGLASWRRKETDIPTRSPLSRVRWRACFASGGEQRMATISIISPAHFLWRDRKDCVTQRTAGKQQSENLKCCKWDGEWRPRLCRLWGSSSVERFFLKRYI